MLKQSASGVIEARSRRSFPCSDVSRFTNDENGLWGIPGKCLPVVPLVRTIEVLVCRNSFSASFSSREGGLFGLPLRASNKHLLSVRVARAQEPQQAPTFHPSSNPPHHPLGEWPRLPFTARIGRYVCSLQAYLFSLQGWGLTDLPLRASNEGSPRPRVARAQKIIRLHPFLRSASKKGTWPLPFHSSFDRAPSPWL